MCATKNIPKPPVKVAPPKEHTVPQPQNIGSSINTNELRHRHERAQQQYLQQLQQQQQQAAQQAVNGTASPMASTWAQLWQHSMAAAAAASSGSPIGGANASGPQAHALFQQQALMYNAWMQQVYAQYMQELALR